MRKILIFMLLLVLQNAPGLAQSQNHVWANFIESSTPFVNATRLTSNNQGDLIVLGYNEGTLFVDDLELPAKSSRDLFLISYSKDGQKQWAKNYPIGQGRLSMNVDQDNNIRVASSFNHQIELGGSIISANGSDDVIVMKLNPEGEFMWEYHLGSFSQDLVGGIATDEKGNTYAAGTFQGSMTVEGSQINAYNCSDIFLLKLDGAGKLIWFKSFPSSRCDRVSHLLFNDERLYLSGQINDTTWIDSQEIISVGGHDLFISSFDLDGTPMWVNSYFSNRYPDEFRQIIEQDNFLYTVGHFADTLIIKEDSLISKGPNNDYNGFVSKFTKEGISLWTKPIGCLQSGNINHSIAIDNANSLFTSGRDNASGNSPLKLSSFSNLTGDLVSTLQFNEIEGEELLEGNSIHIDEHNEMFIAADVVRYVHTNVNKTVILKVNPTAFEPFVHIRFERKPLDEISKECAVEAISAPTAFDRCGNTLVGTTTQKFPIDAEGQTIVTWDFEDAYGNFASQDQLVTVSPINNTVSMSTSGLMANAGGYSYQWIDCEIDEPIPDAVFQYFEPQIGGNYSVEISSNECSVVSECMEYTVLEVNDLQEDILTIYPNPSSQAIDVKLADGSRGKAHLFDLSGKKLLMQTFHGHTKVDLRAFPPGRYLLQIQTKEETYKRAIIRK